MTGKRLAITIVVVLVLVWIALWQTSTPSVVPQPNRWPEPSNATQSAGTATTSGTLDLPTDPNYIIWDFNPERGVLIGYHPEDNRLVQITLTGDVKNIAVLDGMTPLSISANPKGDQFLLYVLRDSGNRQYMHLNLRAENPKPTALPYTIQGADWLPDGQIAYLYSDGTNLTISMATDFSLSSWQLIAGLSLPYQDSSMSISADGSYALIISNTAKTALVIDIAQKAIHQVNGVVSSAAWADTGHTALLQTNTAESNQVTVLDAATLTTNLIPNAQLPYLLIQRNELLIGITPNYNQDSTKNIDTLTVNTSTGSSTTGTLGVADAEIPYIFFADPVRSQLLIGTETKLTSISFEELVTRVAKP